MEWSKASTRDSLAGKAQSFNFIHPKLYIWPHPSMETLQTLPLAFILNNTLYCSRPSIKNKATYTKLHEQVADVESVWNKTTPLIFTPTHLSNPPRIRQNSNSRSLSPPRKTRLILVAAYEVVACSKTLAQFLSALVSGWSHKAAILELPFEGRVTCVSCAHSWESPLYLFNRRTYVRKVQGVVTTIPAVMRLVAASFFVKLLMT